MTRPISRWIIGLSAGLIIGLVIFLLSWDSGVFEGFEQWAIDKRFRLRGDRSIKTDITVVCVEEEFRTRLSREKYAQLILSRIGQSKAIGFDLAFTDANEEMDEWFCIDPKSSDNLENIIKGLDDKNFPKAVQDAFGNNGILIPRAEVIKIEEGQWEVKDTVIREIDGIEIAFNVAVQNDELKVSGKNELRDLLLKYNCSIARNAGLDVYFAFGKRDVEVTSTALDLGERLKALKEKSGCLWTEKIHPEGDTDNLKPSGESSLVEEHVAAPLPMFIRVAKGIGHTHTETKEEEVLRKVPLLIKVGEHIYPSLALQMACDLLGVKERDVYLGRYIELYKEKGKTTKPIRKIPIDDNGFMYINYVGNFDGFQKVCSCSLSKMLSSTSGEEADNGRESSDTILLVGSKRGDRHQTPFGKYPGVFIQANILENILRDKLLVRKGKITHAVTSFFLGILIGAIVLASWSSGAEENTPLFDIGRGYRRGLAGIGIHSTKGFFLAVSLLIFYLLVAQLLFNSGILIQIFGPVLVLSVITLAYFAVGFRRIVSESKAFFRDVKEEKTFIIAFGCFGAIVIIICATALALILTDHKDAAKALLGAIGTAAGFGSSIFAMIIAFRSGKGKSK